MARNETLGASFSIDVTDLKAGLAQANRMIRESESEFKAAAAGMDDWRESQEGLTAKIKSLNSITDVQRKKVGALQAEYDRMIAEGLDPTSKAAVELRTKINNETAALNKNEAELKKQKQALEDLGDETKKTGEAVEDMGGKFEGLKAAGSVAAKSIAAVATACVSAVGAFFGLAESTRDYRREMAQLAQNASDSGADLDAMKDKLAEVSAVTGDADAAMEGMNMLMATGLDTSQIEAASDALAGAATRFDGLKFEGMAEGLQESLATGVAVGPFAELIERTGADLEEFNAGLANCTTEAERQAYAMQFLTESGLMEANAEYKKLNEDLYNAEMAQYNLNDAMAELGAIAEPIMTTLKLLATDLLSSISPFVSLIGEGLTGAFSGADGAADSLAEGLTGIVTTLLDKIVSMLPFVIETVVAIIPKLLTALLEQLPTILTTLVGMVVQLVNGLSAMLPTIVQAIMTVLPQLIKALYSSIPQLLQAAITLLMAIVDAIPTIITALLQELPSIGKTVHAALLEAVPMLIDAAIQLFMTLVEAIPTIIDALVAALPSIISTIISGLIKAIPLLLTSAVKLLSAIVSAIPKLLPALIKAVPQIIGAIVNGLADGVSEVSEVGGDIIRGLWNGIEDMGSWIGKKIKGFGESVLGGIKDFFGIHSPSKVMADEVGKNLALGIGQGFEQNIAGVNKQITSAMDFDGGVGVVGNVGARTGRSVVVNQYNTYSQAHSRVELYKTKQATAAAVRLAMQGA